jgi:hypothetical protein
MRYLIITYVQRADRRNKFRQDEQVEVARRVKPQDLATGSVILDFRTQQVIKSSVGDQVAPKDFQKIRDYYYQHYKDLIDDLEAVNPQAVADAG